MWHRTHQLIPFTSKSLHAAIGHSRAGRRLALWSRTSKCSGAGKSDAHAAELEPTSGIYNIPLLLQHSKRSRFGGFAVRFPDVIDRLDARTSNQESTSNHQPETVALLE